MSQSDENMPDTDAEFDADSDRGSDGRLRRRKRWYWAFRIAGLLLVAPVVMGLVAAVLLIEREVSAPSWIVRDVETRAADVLAGGEITFESMNITLGKDLHPRLVLRNTVLRDADGGVLARVPRIDSLVSPRGALQGRVLPQEIFISGAQLSIRRAVDGSVALAFEQGAEAVGQGDTFADLLLQMEGFFESGPLEALEMVQADGLIINYADARAGRSWVVDDGRISLELTDDVMALRANVALLSGRAFVTDAEFTYESPLGSRGAELGLRFSDAAAVDLASQTAGLSWLSVLDAPISGALRGRFDQDGVFGEASATLQIGAGEVRPRADIRPIAFEGARTYLTYDPGRGALTFDLIELDSPWGAIEADAQAFMITSPDGRPEGFIGQVAMAPAVLEPHGVFGSGVELDGAQLDFRLSLDPFSIELGQAVLLSQDAPLRFSGQVRAAADGWNVALDLVADAISTDRLFTLWPEGLTPKTRTWLEQNVSGGEWRNLFLSVRSAPGTPVTTGLTAEFTDTTVQFMRTIPPIQNARGVLSIGERRMALSLDEGQVRAPEGGALDLAGSTLVVPTMGIPNPPATFALAIEGRVTAAMSLLRLEPFNVLSNSDLPASFAEGQAEITVDLTMPMGQGVDPTDRVWTAQARVRDVRSSVLVPDQVVTSSALSLTADRESLVVQGPVRLGGIPAEVTFARGLGPGSEGTARLDAGITLGAAFLDTFNIDLPDGMVRGEGPAQLRLNLSDPQAPAFELTSNLRGIGLSLAGLDWSKSPQSTGSLRLAGQLGATPRIDDLSLSAPGLEARGDIRLAPGGGLERAAFERVRVGGWLDAPVVLLGRGAGRPAAIQIAGGTLDLRDANFGAGNGNGDSGGPIEIALDRLQVTESIWLSDFRGAFTTGAGFQGSFNGAINGAAPINGTIVPVEGRPAVRIVSDDAGAVFRASGLLRNAYAGTFDLTLLPAGAEGSYDGTMVGRDLRVRDAPALASLLDAVSVVGLLSQLDGQGLLFTDVDAQFRLTPDQVVLTQSSAVGPGLGISMDGIFSTASGTMDFQGVLSPFYALNGIGAVLTRPGEGLIGFNFTLRGPVDSASVGVNPLSALTPGMFREIFRRPPPAVGN